MGEAEEETLTARGGRRRREEKEGKGGYLEGRYFACVKKAQAATRKEEIPSLYAA